MRLTRRTLLPLLALPAACNLPPPMPGVTLPPEAPVAQGVTDPTRSAILSTSYVFNRPATVAGNPAAAAEALANLEYLAASIPTDPTYRDFDPLVPPLLAEGRDEARAAMGFRAGAPSQVAMDALYGASAALRTGNTARAEAALAPIASGQEGVVLARLRSMPPMPRAGFATARAQQALTARDRQGRGDRGGLRY